MSELPPPARALLAEKGGAPPFTLVRHLPSAELADWISWYWIVRWDVARGGRFHQETLPYPCVNLVFERGASAAYGVITGRGSRYLEGRGLVLGAKLHPGAFYPIWRRPVAELCDRAIPLAEVLGPECASAEAHILAAGDDAAMIARAEPIFAHRRPPPDELAALARRIVERIAADRELTKVDAILADVAKSKRSLQRLFAKYVGVSPKWVIQRYRLQDAAEKLAAGRAVDLARLAAELGYFDQPHFVKDFKAMVGKSPGEYARAAR